MRIFAAAFRLAQDLNLGTEVAVKLIDSSMAESLEAIGRFRQEAQAAARIRSTHVVQILDHGVDQDRPFIAMELLSQSGKTRATQRSVK